MIDTNVDHVVVYRDKSASDQPFRWRAVAANGEEVSQGESHGSGPDAERAARGVFGEDVKIVRDLPELEQPLLDEDPDQTEGVDA